ncbi:MAG: LLM class flavin-dependent oxidoreductase, partial [Acidimicrobiia bacterium]|nr:LLM class flavin-dependent oxidoreductase [Acidimicrobiia bacterium]
MTDSSPLATETGELPIIRPGSARSALSHEQFRRIFIASFGSNIGSWSTIHPFRKEIPIYLAAEGPKNVALAAEICDGWLPLFYSPKDDAHYRRCLDEGFAKSGDASKRDRFEVVSSLFVVPGDDADKCADFIRPFVALYAGGMGAKGANFHFEVFARMGWEHIANQVQ